MSATGPRIRDASPADSAAVRALCRRLDPNDYASETWELWMGAPASVQLVAESAGRIVGCVRAEAVAPGEAFSQGLRVDPEFRRRGVARGLMEHQNERLHDLGCSTMRGVTAAANRRARDFFSTIAQREVGAVARRRLHGWPSESLEIPRGAELDRVVATARRHGRLASRLGRAHFKRIYFSATRDTLAEATAAGRVIDLGEACALLDPWSGESRWITALAGSPQRVASWLATIARTRPGAPGTLVVEAADEPWLQQLLDRLGFEPAAADDRYVIVEARLGAATSGA